MSWPTYSRSTAPSTGSAPCTTWCSASSSCDHFPAEVAQNVATYAQALGIDDDFVPVARRYGQGAFGLACVRGRLAALVSMRKRRSIPEHQ